MSLIKSLFQGTLLAVTTGLVSCGNTHEEIQQEATATPLSTMDQEIAQAKADRIAHAKADTNAYFPKAVRDMMDTSFKFEEPAMRNEDILQWSAKATIPGDHGLEDVFSIRSTSYYKGRTPSLTYTIYTQEAKTAVKPGDRAKEFNYLRFAQSGKDLVVSQNKNLAEGDTVKNVNIDVNKMFKDLRNSCGDNLADQRAKVLQSLKIQPR